MALISGYPLIKSGYFDTARQQEIYYSHSTIIIKGSSGR